MVKEKRDKILIVAVYRVVDYLLEHGIVPDFIIIEGPKAGGHLGFTKEEVINGTAKNTDEIYLLSLVEKVKNAGAIGINFNHKSASKELVDVFHENGLLVSIWTVNNKLKMRRILTFAPDNITTRKPDKLSKFVKKYMRKF